MGKIEIFNGKDEKYYFRVKAKNGEVVAVSEAYNSLQACEDGIDSLRENVDSDIYNYATK